MDNITGKANWFQEETNVIEEKEVIVEKLAYKPFDKKLFCEIVEEAQLEYRVTKNKAMGDALVHLEIANKILNN